MRIHPSAIRITGAIVVFGYGYHLIIQRSKSRGGSISRDGFSSEAMWKPVTVGKESKEVE